MSHYNKKYDKFIDPLYGAKRDFDEDTLLLQSNVISHSYSVNERIDMTMHKTYSIDPAGCEDADDAFSIYEENEKMFLAIHIADPTEYINVQSSLWADIEKRVVTRYPSNKPPVHMIPNEIMEKSSLMVNQYGEIKLAITILTEIDKNTYKPVGGIKLLFTKIRVETQNALSYKKAGEDADIIETLKNGLLISKALYDIRSEKTRGTVLNEVSISFPRYDSESMYLYSDTKTEIAMKQMIAEYAIFANTFIGEYLKINFEGAGLYRICDAKDWLNTVNPEITGQELLNEIIVNGIQAEYMSTVNPHDLVGAAEYTHFTSPIRRLSDCVCHYLLKYIHLKNSNHDLRVPFSNDQLKKYSDDCLKMSRSIKNIQYKDTKFRLIQTMSAMLVINCTIDLGYYVTCYKANFLNIIINKINEHTVYLSYTLRIADLQTEYTLKEEKQITIKEVNCIGKFDEGSIPELDRLFI
jgi:exoribonuclease R